MISASRKRKNKRLRIKRERRLQAKQQQQQQQDIQSIMSNNIEMTPTNTTSNGEHQQLEQPGSSFGADVHSLPTLAELTGKRGGPPQDVIYSQTENGQHQQQNGRGGYHHEEDDDYLDNHSLTEDDIFLMQEGDEDITGLRSARLFFVTLCLISLTLGLTFGLLEKDFFNDEYNHDFRFRQVVDHLGSWSVSNYDDLLAPHPTPQFLAANWIAHDDPQQLRVPTGRSLKTPDGYTFAVRYVLAVLYFATGGHDNEWTDNLQFLSDRHYCEWFQISRDAQNRNNPVPKGVGCHNLILSNHFHEHEVYEIDTLFMDNNNLRNRLPSELGILTTLRIFNLEQNVLTGQLPNDMFYKLSNIEHLSLSHNSLTGTFPGWMNFLETGVKLESLDLSFNFLTGFLPQDLGTVANSLRGLALDHNLLEGPMNRIFENNYGANLNTLIGAQALTNLALLYLDNNQFTGTINRFFMKELTDLRRLDLSGNLLQGSIPLHLLNMPHLEILDLHNNDNIAGTLPQNIPSNTVLTLLALHQNKIQGPIPSRIQNLRQLQHLDLSNNRLSSSEIPDEIGQLTNLRYLFLSNNPLFEEGPIPSFLRQLTNLRELSLKNTKRTGTLSEDLFSVGGGLSRLILLDLEDNQIYGTLPPVMGTMRNLEFLLLNQNMLTGTIPTEFELLISLRLFLVDGNELRGDMDMFCSRPQLDSITPYLTADCGIGDDKVVEIKCGCCFQCCTNNNPCDDNSMVPSLDPMWQLGYERVVYRFDDRTTLYSTSNSANNDNNNNN